MRGRRWGIFGTLGAAGAAAITTIILVTSGPVSTANIWVNTTAGASPSRCSTPCAYDPTHAYGSLQSAFAAVTSGTDTIVIHDGTYTSAQTVYPNASATAPIAIKPQSSTGVSFTNVVQIKASDVELDGFQFQMFTSQSGHPFNIVVQPPSGGLGSYACVSNVTLRNIQGGNFSLNNGVSNVNIVGGTYSERGWRLGQTPDGTTSWNAPTIGASSSFLCPDSSTIAAPATDVTVNGAKFGDNFPACEDNTTYGNNPQATCVEPSHPDCFHIYGPTIGLTVENNWFDHCMGFYLNLNVEDHGQGNTTIKNAVFQNNIFGDDNHGGIGTTDCNGNTVSSQQVSCDSWDQITQAGTGPSYVQCDNVVFRDNTWGHDQTNNPLFGINCPLASGATQGVQFYNNIITDWGSLSCGTGLTFDYNLFVGGTTCGTHATTGSAAFLQPTDTAVATPYAFASVPWTSNFVPGVGSAAIGVGNCTATTAATTDYNGASRPTGACDVGAINH